ncbi:leucine-rich repeat protein [Lacticaseibacillus pabuli]|uniref:Leucine-rich repeat protein n=1 Tax=Lacticaseibacillus pabuli TaxID=3025672 RepID=A0ABY7WVH1_9LACO|nr:MBG domain-containing protein [Lacticaseibacillus sp. KACC 23028]WDF83150.1 leucine-rich repeat protein [Lacticaseibacillus sp. KACC 23028]
MNRQQSKQTVENTRIHYKMYKSGKNWVFAGILGITFAFAAALVPESSVSASADTPDASAAVTTAKAEAPKTVTLSSSTGDQSANNGADSAAVSDSDAADKSTGVSNDQVANDATATKSDDSAVTSTTDEKTADNAATQSATAKTDQATSDSAQTDNDNGVDASAKVTSDDASQQAVKSEQQTADDAAANGDTRSDVKDPAEESHDSSAKAKDNDSAATDVKTGTTTPLKKVQMLSEGVVSDYQIDLTGTGKVSTGWIIDTDAAGNNVATFTGSGSWFTSTDTVTLPDTITVDGTTYTVTTIASNALESRNITALVLPSTVTDIEANAFTYSSFKTVQLPAALQTIGDSAFYSNSTLTSVDFSQSPNLTSIGSNAFARAGALTSVNFTDNTKLANMGEGAFVQIYTLTGPVDLQNTVLTSIPKNAFQSDPVTSVTIPATVQSIGETAFGYDNQLTSLVFAPGSQLTDIGLGAFVSSSLPTITIPDSVKTIGENAFAYDHALTELNIGANSQLQSVGNGAFAYGSIGNSLKLPNTLESVGDNAFVGNRLPNVDLGTGVKTIGDLAFATNSLAQDLSIPDSVTSIGNQAFANNMLTGVSDQSPVSVGSDAFKNNRMNQLDLPNATYTSGPATDQRANAFIDLLHQPDISHVTLDQLFRTVAIGNETNSNLDISNVTNGVTYDAANGFTIPASRANTYDFDWKLVDADGNTTYAGTYTVHVTNPNVKVFNSNADFGSPWATSNNFFSAQTDTGVNLPLAEMTVTLTAPDGTSQTVTTSQFVALRQAGDWTATYADGSLSGTATITVADQIKDPYVLSGKPGVPYDGHAHTPISGFYDLNVTVNGNSNTISLQNSDLEVLAADGTPATAGVIDVGSYKVQLTASGLARVLSIVDPLLRNKLVDNGSTALLIIDPTIVPLTLSDANFTYDGEKTASDATGLTAEFQASGTTTSTSITLSQDDIVVKNGSTDAGSYVYSLSTIGLAKLNAALGANEAIGSAAGTITINPKAITITAPDETMAYSGKVYPGSLEATITGQPKNGVAPVYTMTDVSGKIDKGTYPITITLDPSANKNYTITPVNGQLVITAEPVEAAKIQVGGGSKVYDGDATTDQTTFDVTLPSGWTTPNFDDTDFDLSGITSQNVGTYGVTLNAAGIAKINAANTNYNVKGVTAGRFSITPAVITINVANATKQYDGTAYTDPLKATISGKPDKGDDVTYKLTDVSGDTNVGTYHLSADPKANLNYTFNVNPGQLTITAAPVEAAKIQVGGGSKVYDGDATTDQTTYDVTLPSGWTTPNFDDTDFDLSGITSQNVGTYDVTLNAAGIAKINAANTNYNVKGVTAGRFSITPAVITINVDNAMKTYDGTAYSDPLTATVSGKPEKGDDVKYTVLDITKGKNVGTYRLTAEPTASLNYTFVVNPGQLTIAPAPITITAPTVSKTYNGQPYTGPFDATVVGLPVNGDALDYTLTNISKIVNIGKYTVTVTADANKNKNYKITTVSGSLTITDPNGNGGTPTPGGNGGTTTPTPGGNGGTTTPGGNGGTTTPTPGGNGGTTTPTPGGNGGTTTPTPKPNKNGNGTGTNGGHSDLPNTFTTNKGHGKGTRAGYTNGQMSTDSQSTSQATQAPLSGNQTDNKAELPQTGDSQNGAVTVMGIALASVLGLFGLAGRKRNND